VDSLASRSVEFKTLRELDSENVKAIR